MPATLSAVEEAPARTGIVPSTPTVNDLAIRVGTVNGSGSQSANLVILRSLYAMGIPCSGKNVFPSNIEGLAHLVPHPRQRQADTSAISSILRSSSA